MDRRVNPEGLALIKRFEGLRLRAYRDPVGIWTIGYGHIRTAKAGMVITEPQAEELLRADLDRFERAVAAAVAGAATTDNQFAALVSFAFNVGAAGLRRSSVLRWHRAGDPQKAAAAFLLWNKAGGTVLSGLTRRRKAEAALYLKGDA